MKKRTIRLMTFNILVDKKKEAPYSWEGRREQIVKLLKYYNPDIFCIQEALEHQKIYLAEAFTEYSCFGVGRNDGKGSGEQVPIFYKKDIFTLENEGYFWLSETPEIAGSIGWDAKLPRTVVWKRLKHNLSKKSFLVANTHYDHVGKKANKNSANLIYDELTAKNCDEPIILCGDFNSAEDFSAYKELLACGFKDAYKERDIICYGLPFTYHKFLMDSYIKEAASLQQENDRVFRAIDHVFYIGQVKPMRYGILPDNEAGVYPSDHFPVLCDLAIE
ncbi:endonuclease/exonuclease/phosphatase family protein [Clostridium sp. 19966]|uniref:endonuclease/exonuclease/phosphatase family protein n=1 Tax=Clostridium sp. 19966 TaxID=2768166 RepID=UPI0028DFEB5B|nr:endonuclease/exonuclease/phosphatase family protein [Clostridium sp. 19966]MDT8717727.1 endonuclease/exonuclease/phosphatase family protein [Clostridium sp. 19966]